MSADARLAIDFCGEGGCPDGTFALGFAPDGRTLTAVVNYATPGPSGPVRAASTPAGGPGRRVHVERDQPAICHPRRHPQPPGSHPVGGGNGGLPLLAPDGRTVVDGAPFGSFGITLWKLPMTRTSHAQARASRA